MDVDASYLKNHKIAMKIKDEINFLIEKIRYTVGNKNNYFLKQLQLKRIQEKYGFKVFIETGTYKGTMLEYLKNYFEILYSCEIDEHLYLECKDKFKKDKKIILYHGNSADVLLTIMSQIQQPSLIWLDAHYSGEGTGKSATDSPIKQELETIFKSPYPHYIVIDDADYFTGSNGYLTIPELKKLCTSMPNLKSFFVVWNTIHIILNEKQGN